MNRLLRYLPQSLRRRLEGRIYLQRVIRNTGWVFAERVLKQAVGFLIGVWIARYAGPEQYGLLNYAGAFVAIFSFMGTLGLDGLVVRDMVRSPAAKDEILGSLLIMRLIGTSIMAVLIVETLHSSALAGAAARALILPIALGQVLLVSDSVDCWFQANIASRRAAVVRITALFIVGIVRIALIVQQASMTAFAWAIFAESTLIGIGMLLMYVRSGQRLRELAPTWRQCRRLLVEGWPLLLLAMVMAFFQRLDQVMLGEMGNYTEVGTFAFAARIVEATYILPTVVAMSVFPGMVKARATDPAGYESHVQKLCNMLVWVAVGVALCLSQLSTPLISILAGSDFSNSADVLLILSWMPVFFFFHLLRQRWLLAENALHAAMAIELSACLISVVMNLLLIPRYGAVGAAVSSLAGIAGGTLLVAPFSALVRRSIGMFVQAVLVPVRLASRGHL